MLGKLLRTPRLMADEKRQTISRLIEDDRAVTAIEYALIEP
jgi:hypothetical protein